MAFQRAVGLAIFAQHPLDIIIRRIQPKLIKKSRFLGRRSRGALALFQSGLRREPDRKAPEVVVVFTVGFSKGRLASKAVADLEADVEDGIFAKVCSAASGVG